MVYAAHIYTIRLYNMSLTISCVCVCVRVCVRAFVLTSLVEISAVVADVVVRRSSASQICEGHVLARALVMSLSSSC